MSTPDLKSLEQQAAAAIESGDPADAKRFAQACGMQPADFQAQLQERGAEQLALVVQTHLDASNAGISVQLRSVKTEWGNQFEAEITSGYRAGKMICHNGSETPVRWPTSDEAKTWLKDTGYTVEANESRAVSLAETTLTFSLPDDFGLGWEYTNMRLYGAHHAWAGSYDKSESANFAHDALMQLPEVQSSYLCIGLTCNVDCKVTALTEAAAIQSRLQAVVDAFENRPERQISVRGSNFYDARVTEHDANDPEIEVVSDMPYLNYLAKYVPLAEALPALSGHDLEALRSEADAHQQAKVADKDDSPSPGM